MMPLLTAKAQSLASPPGSRVTAWQQDSSKNLRDLSPSSRASVIV